MELRDALSQISAIRTHIARTEVFRGFRSIPTAFSGVLALGAAAYQASALPDPMATLPEFLGLWIMTAALTVVAVGAEIVSRCMRSASALDREKSWLAVSQFLPCVVAGALLTGVIATSIPESAAMLPGLWAVLYSLGIFATFRLLPAPVFWVGVYYLGAGLGALIYATESAALSPWSMALSFGVGQLLLAGVLYYTLERVSNA